MKIDSFIAKHAENNPDHIAVIQGENRVTYKDLEEDIKNITSALEGFSNTRFAIMAESGIQYIKMLMAVYRSQNTAIPMPIEMPLFSLEQILDTASVNNIIVTESQYSKTEDAFFDRFSTVKVVQKDSSVETIRENTAEKVNNLDLRLVLYTSGTTGNPKGVMLSDRNLIANAESIIEILGITPEDNAALVISPHHAYGNSIINSHLVAGGTISIGSMNFMGSTFNLLESGVSIFYGVPSTYRILLRYPDRFKQAFSKVRLAASAGGAMDDYILNNIRLSNPDVTILPMYGQTEATARLAYLPPEDVDEYVHTIGRAIPGVTLDVFDGDNRSLEANIEGELVAKGDNIMLGYLDDEVATGKKIIDGWMHTGDLAEKLPNGYFRLMGRKDDLIKIGDHRVNPREIEKYIEKNNVVYNVFIVPVPHEIMGNAISLLVMPEKDTNIDDLFLFCRKSLPGYLYPQEILLIDHLPLSENGKISNRSIIREYENVKSCM